MKDHLLELFNIISHKQISNHISRGHPEIRSWIDGLTSDISELKNFNQKIRYALFGDLPSCSGSIKSKRWISLSDGYGYCGRASECSCARASVSSKISAAKNSLSEEQRAEINDKRTKTNLDRYGVSNVGQLDAVKEKQKLFYQDQEKVAETVTKMRSTMLERYGVENPQQSPELRKKFRATLLERYGVDNPMKSDMISSKAIKTKQSRYEPYHLAKLNYEQFKKNVIENFGVEVLLSKEDYTGVGSRPFLTFRCPQCLSTFDKRFDYASPPRCRACYPADVSYKSNQELQLLEFIKNIYPGSIISGDRSAISPYEIDIYLPEIGIGIEYCGLYWHSELSGKKSWNYHHRKWKAAADRGIRLFTIFSDEWLEKRSIVENIMRAKLEQQPSSAYARNCQLSSISRDQAEEFYEHHHLLGSPVRLPINYGLIYKGDMIAVMSFIKDEDGYELSRFASDGRIPGAASRLLHGFIRGYNPKKIVSFSDNRYSDGHLYQTLGFKTTSIVPPMQSYVKDYQKRYHKLSLSKKKLLKMHPHINTDLTEWEILKSLNYDRIWDCGKIKWTWMAT